VLAFNLLAGVWQHDFQAMAKDIGPMLLVVGLIQTGGAYILWARASRYFSGTRLSEFLLLTIPFTFLIEYLVLDVSINAWQIAGALLLILGAYINIRVYQNR
jgi:drug/metabolite transporter (DMT)-like permease